MCSSQRRWSYTPRMALGWVIYIFGWNIPWRLPSSVFERCCKADESQNTYVLCWQWNMWKCYSVCTSLTLSVCVWMSCVLYQRHAGLSQASIVWSNPPECDRSGQRSRERWPPLQNHAVPFTTTCSYKYLHMCEQCLWRIVSLFTGIQKIWRKKIFSLKKLRKRIY